jgi:hypothetical protein
MARERGVGEARQLVQIPGLNDRDCGPAPAIRTRLDVGQEPVIGMPFRVERSNHIRCVRVEHVHVRVSRCILDRIIIGHDVPLPR